MGRKVGPVQVTTTAKKVVRRVGHEINSSKKRKMEVANPCPTPPAAHPFSSSHLIALLSSALKMAPSSSALLSPPVVVPPAPPEV